MSGFLPDTASRLDPRQNRTLVSRLPVPCTSTKLRTATGRPAEPSQCRSRIQDRALVRADTVSSVASCSSMRSLRVLSPMLLCVRILATVKDQSASRCRNAPGHTIASVRSSRRAIQLLPPFLPMAATLSGVAIHQKLLSHKPPETTATKAQFACSCFRESAKQGAFRRPMNVLLRRNAD